MKRNRSKLISAVAMLVISAVAVTSATYAWFTMQDTVTATGLTLTAAAPATVQIQEGTSLTEGGWLQDIILKDTAKTFRPVSTATALNDSFFEINSNNAIVDDTEIAKSGNAFKLLPAVTGTSQYYYDTTLNFRTKGTYPVDLILSNLTLGSTGDLNKAIRVAFLGTDGTAYSRGTDPLIYASAAATYKAAATVDTLSGNIAPLTAGASNVVIRVPVNADANAYGEVVSVKVRIYLEGQDAACIKANLNSALQVNMTFYGTEVTAA